MTPDSAVELSHTPDGVKRVLPRSLLGFPSSAFRLGKIASKSLKTGAFLQISLRSLCFSENPSNSTRSASVIGSKFHLSHVFFPDASPSLPAVFFHVDRLAAPTHFQILSFPTCRVGHRRVVLKPLYDPPLSRSEKLPTTQAFLRPVHSLEASTRPPAHAFSQIV